ncbi:hypothetical protein [Thalassotalea sp. Y01]|uniref:hypothetical protein n=1 Tax=Thalassotalea sp. Y01 TaxID=2729613 RepID=UPI00145E9EE8|nr:hypothetical protein [Thalassotalea sp. Y01]NMP16121.1 hypothetical protein [Thalassotalea sp. Y01]
MRKLLLTAALIASLGVIGNATANTELNANTKKVEQQALSETEELAELSKKLNNPLADLWMLWTQHDVTSLEDKAGNSYISHSTKFQPVMSFDFSDDYNFILRPVFQFQSIEVPGMERENGLGDTAVLAAIGPKTPKNGWTIGAGVSAFLPTAEETYLSTNGADQFAIGPSLIAIKLGEKYTYGAVVQHFEGVGQSEAVNSKGEEEDLSLTDIQYIWRVRMSSKLQIGMAPNITIDWNKSGSDKYTVPVGLGFDYMTRFGDTPVRLAVEGYRYVMQADEFGPEWGIRFVVIPVVKNPLL